MLTQAGRRLVGHAAPLVEEFARLPGRVNDLSQHERVLRYASHEAFGTYFTHLILDVGEDTAGATIEHRYLPPGAIERSVLAGDSDAGITYAPVPTEGVQLTEIGRIEMGVYGLARFAVCRIPSDPSPHRSCRPTVA